MSTTAPISGRKVTSESRLFISAPRPEASESVRMTSPSTMAKA